jgi:hypothetical protein
MFCEHPECDEMRTHYNETKYTDKESGVKYRVVTDSCAKHVEWAMEKNDQVIRKKFSLGEVA